MKPQKEVRIKKVTPASKRGVLWLIIFFFSAVVLWVFIMRLLIHYRYPVHNQTKIVKSGLLYELKINRTLYHPGQSILLKLMIRNNSPKTVVLHFRTTQRVNFVVEKMLNFIFFKVPTIVWESSYHIFARPIPNHLVLKPKSERVFEDSWNQKNVRGQQVPQGYYVISAHLLNTGSKTVLELPAEMHK